MEAKMKKALISPNEPVQTGHRVAQVEPVENIFSVAEPLYWIDCEDDVVADQFWFNTETQTIVAVPPPPKPRLNVTNTVGDAPNVIA